MAKIFFLVIVFIYFFLSFFIDVRVGNKQEGRKKTHTTDQVMACFWSESLACLA